MQSAITVEDLCRKLRPILGKKIDKLYTQYALTDSRDKKEEIEQALNALYQKTLNTSLLTERVLLEPPQKDVIAGEYPLGTVTYADKELYPFGLREKDWIRHLCISGMSGSGKTNFAYQVLGNLINKKKPFLVFDWKKSFRPLLRIDKEILLFTVGNDEISNYFRFNINKPPKGVGPREWLNFLADLINESFSASFGVHKILVQTIDKAFEDFGVYEGSNNYPTWRQIRDRLDKKEQDIKNSKGRESEWITSAQRIAHALTFGNFGDAINHKGSDALSIEDIFDKKIIFELHALNNTEKKFFCEFILAYIYKYKKINDQEESADFKYAILVDEAHNIFLKDKPNFVKESITDMVYREVREYGISLICLDQHISKLSDTVAGNSACNVAFQQMLPQDLETVSSLMGIREQKKFFSMIPVGQAIVRLAERFLSPFIIKVPLIDLKDKKIGDVDIAIKMKKFGEYYKKLQQTKKDMNISKVSKLVTTAKDLDITFRTAGVNAPAEFLAKQAKIKQAVEKALIVKKKIVLNNHLQKDIVGQLDKIMPSNHDLTSVKDYFKSKNYKNADINKAIKYYFAACKSDDSKKVTVSKNVKKAKEKPTKPKMYSITLEEKNFINCVFKFPDKSTTEIYKLLRISARKGTEIKNNLTEMGLINIKEERNNKGWKKQLQLSKIVIESLNAPKNEGVLIY